MFDRNLVSTPTTAPLSQTEVKKVLTSTPLISKAATVATTSYVPKGLNSASGIGALFNSPLAYARVPVTPVMATVPTVDFNMTTRRFTTSNPYVSTSAGLALQDGFMVTPRMRAYPIVKGIAFSGPYNIDLEATSALPTVISIAYVGCADLVAWAYQKFTG
jgi:hypothetical protein